MPNKSKKLIILKKITKIIKIIWLLLGALIIYWTGYWYYKLNTVNDLAVMVIAFLFSSGIYMLAIYLPVTLALATIYFILRKKKIL